MFKFIFKNALYYIVWEKFKAQFITILVSALLIIGIFYLYNDLYQVVALSSTNDLYLLVLAKWFYISLIVLFNCYKIFYNKKDTTNIKSLKDDDLPYHKNILSKTKLSTKTDMILDKYLKKKNNNE